MPTKRWSLAAVRLFFDGRDHLVALGGSHLLGELGPSATELYTP